MSSVDKVKEFVEYLEKAKIPIGTYNMHTEDFIPVIYKYVSSERVLPVYPMWVTELCGQHNHRL